MRFAVFTMLFFMLGVSPLFAGKEGMSTYDRVISSGKIRCGYAMWKPSLYKDLATDELKGFFYEFSEELGKRLGLEIVWAEETGWGTIVEGLITKRYDMVCAGLWANSSRGKHIDFSAPVFYSPLYLVTRIDDTRFDEDLSLLNSEAYTIAVLEGEMSSIAARKNFPEAKTHSIPQISDYTLLLKDVETKKADVTLVEPGIFHEYAEHNPGLLKIVNKQSPINVFPTGFGLPRGQYEFKRMIDVTLSEMIYDGTIDRILKKYEKTSDAYLRVSKPYEVQP